MQRFKNVVYFLNGCVLVWVRNEYDVALLIDTNASQFMLVHRLNNGYEFVDSLSNLFRGYIYEKDNKVVLEFEYTGGKEDKYIRNDKCHFGALRTTFYTLQSATIDVFLTFAEDVKKVYYRYANNTFWNPKRKKYYSLNSKYDEHACSGRYHRINDYDSVFSRGYFNLDY